MSPGTIVNGGIRHMKGKYFEEITLGEKFTSQGHTITETDIVLFAGLSGDYSSPHTNDERCKTTPFKKKIAHGLLITSIASDYSLAQECSKGPAWPIWEPQ